MTQAARPIRLAIIRQRYNPFGGAERFVERAVAALSEQGTEVTLFSRQWKAQSNFVNVRVNPFYMGSAWRDRSFARAVCAEVARREFDLVQSHERLSCCDIYRAGDGVHREWLRQRSREASPLQRLGFKLNSFHRYTLAAERTMFASPRLRAVICNSTMVRDEILGYFDIAPSKLHVIHSGVDTHHFDPRVIAPLRQACRQQLSIPDSVFTLLFVGSGFARKGLSTVLRALAQSRAASLIVVGHDKHAARYERQAASLGITERVRFVGAQQDVRPYYAAADAFALPSLYEPFPNAMLEALACALPIVTSEKCGGADIVRESECGFVIDALDAKGCAAAIDELAVAATRDAMSQRARAIAQRFTLENMAAQLWQLYSRLLSERAAT